nr:hypothetical protein CFP56_77832 [Quercus suber]
MAENLVQRVNRGRARFERGNSSLGLNLDSLDRTTSPRTELGQRGNVISATQNNSQGLTRSLDTGLDNLNSLSPISPGPGPPSPGLAYSDPYPFSELQKDQMKELNPRNSTASDVSGKRLRVEFGRLGRNIRQRLLCGFCPKEGTRKPIPSVMSQTEAASDQELNTTQLQDTGSC